MNSHRPDKISQIYSAARDLDKEKRDAFLTTSCGEDSSLRAEVERLLAQRENTSTGPLEEIAHYRLIEKLGEGGMGIVYRAFDTRLDRFVAIKLLPPDKVASAERKFRFVQEAKSASSLNHPKIITVHDIGSVGDVSFIVMEFVQVKTLDRLIG